MAVVAGGLSAFFIFATKLRNSTKSAFPWHICCLNVEEFRVLVHAVVHDNREPVSSGTKLLECQALTQYWVAGTS